MHPSTEEQIFLRQLRDKRSPKDRGKPWNSYGKKGDINIIAYCFEHPNDVLVILTNDNGIVAMADEITATCNNLHVLSWQNELVKRF